MFRISDLASLAPHSGMSCPPVSERPTLVRKEAILELVTDLLFLHIHLQMYTYVTSKASTHIFLYTHSDTLVHMYTCTPSVCTHILYIHIILCTHTLLHLYTHIFLYIHTFSYVHTLFFRCTHTHVSYVYIKIL